MSLPPKPLPEAFWPTIKQAIDKGSNTNSDNQAITPQCPICMEPLPVKSFPAEGELDAEVLLCGHVLCQPCRKQWEQSDLGDRCPACRTTLYCKRCEVSAIPLTIPKNDEGSSLPPGIPEGNQDFCPDCQAEVEFHKAVENGEWPHNLDEMEPGFISLFYHVVNDIEKDGDVATMSRVQDAIMDTIMQEFSNMMVSRRMVTLGRGNTLREANPWYAENKTRQENRRNGIIGFDSEDDEEPGANTPAGIPHRIGDPFVVGLHERHGNVHIPLNARPGDVIYGGPHPWDHGLANQFDVQDGIARPNAEAPRSDNISSIVRAIWGPERPEGPEAGRARGEAEVVPRETDEPMRASRQVPLPVFARPSAVTQTAQDDDRQPPDADELRQWAEFLQLQREGNPSPAAARAARPARVHPEGSAAAILEQLRPVDEHYYFDMPTWDEYVDNADAYLASHANDPNWPPLTRAEYIAEHEEYMRRLVANRTAASSSSAASGAQNSSSMDMDDSDEEMSSGDQPVSER
ncbi:hypothetical protein FVEG_05621 [Fusarium verticillioides 7600]|uniref:RING-type domain-containing protein n=1 Tax=Gibberella moniliformis (strain M3125 / FGSC 7600) TaxID=334819 RepID=W7LZ55_GIBM7|nr:hypothetical protein FVEG_05621 [Fusarium verticillioides 7600]EWG44608.1 hypothetical protein FVEG_05621 [Fusarium verticillioides 7600]RBR00969.1 hypothetical protein FVER53263_05621 [Fusarium verticillioides]